MFAMRFLLVFLGSYLLLQLGYTLYLAWFEPNIDSLSYVTTWVLTQLYEGASMVEKPGEAKLVFLIHGKAIINIKEACNGLSVAISLWAFLIAYRQPLKYYFWVVPFASLALFLANVFRLFALVIIKQNYSNNFVFFHEYLFPGILYLFAFGIMVYWVKLKPQD